MSEARGGSVVVVGAGCIGASIAYHLARRGVKDVVVLEKELFAGAGSTSKAAGGVRAQFSTPLNVRISMMSIEDYEKFPAEMNCPPVFFQVGYLFLLSDEPRWATFRRQAEMQRELGLDVQTLTPAEAQGLVPELRVDDVLGATFHARDGLANPHEITQAFVAEARRLGARFEFGRAVTDIVREGDSVVGVDTAAGRVAADWVVNAAGP